MIRSPRTNSVGAEVRMYRYQGFGATAGLHGVASCVCMGETMRERTDVK